MREQLNNMKYMISANENICRSISELYDKCSSENMKEIYKQELGSREDIIVQLKQSMAVMKKRIELTDSIREIVESNLLVLKNIDFYFGNQLKIMNQKDINDILDEYMDK